MKTLQNQYIEITEGKGNKDHFLKQARHLFPELLTVNSTFNDTVKILKGKNILTEAVGGIVTQNPNKPDWFKIFNTNIKEAVGVKDKKEYGDQNTFEKIDKDVAKDLESNFDNSDPKNIDNVYGQSFLMGYLAEMDDPKNADKTVDELKKIVAKNMAQDINYYAKNGMFGVKGIGLEMSKEPKAPTGKYKSSGYGNLKENKLRSIISAIIREELNEGYGVSLEDAKEDAKNKSKEGVVQHVEKTEKDSGMYRVSDWYDSDLTVASYKDGEIFYEKKEEI